MLKILVYQNFCVDYCSVHFLCKFYANMVPSNESKGLKILVHQNFCAEYCAVPFLLKFYANMVPSNKPKGLKILLSQIIYIRRQDQSNPITFIHRERRGPYARPYYGQLPITNYSTHMVPHSGDSRILRRVGFFSAHTW